MPVRIMPAVSSLLLVLGVTYSFFALAEPDGDWSIHSITAAVSVNHDVIVSTSWVAKKDVGDVTVRVTPALAPYVTVTPSSYKAVSEGDILPIEILIQAPLEATEATIEGVVKIRADGARTKRTFPIPLPVIVDVLLSDGETEFFVAPDDGISFEYPALGVSSRVAVNEENGAVTSIDVELESKEFDDTLISTFVLSVVDKPWGLPLVEWFKENIDLEDLLLPNATFSFRTLSSGVDVLELTGLVPEEHDSGPLSLFYAAIPDGGLVVSATLSHNHELDLHGASDSTGQQALLETIVSSLIFP